MTSNDDAMEELDMERAEERSASVQCKRILFAFKVKFVPSQGHRCVRQADERKGVCVATYSLRIEVSCKGKHFDEVEGKERGKKLKRRRS